MRINKIDLKNFRCYQDATFEFPAPLAYLVSGNNAGKSSLLDAIEFCLSGRTRGTDDAGRGAKQHLIRDGQDTASVTLTFGNGATLTRAITAAGVKVLPADGGGWNRALVRLLVNGASFLDLEHAAAKALLLELLDVRVPVGDKTLTLDELEAAYQKAFEARRQAKADLQAIKVPPPPEGEDAPNLARLEEVLAGLREKEKALLAEQAAGTGKREALDAEIARLQKRLADLRAQINPDLAENLQTATERAAMLDDDEGAGSEYSDLQAEAETIGNRAAARLAHLDGKRELVEKLKAHKPSHGCVLETDIPCATAGKHFADFIARLKREIADGEREHQADTERSQVIAARLRDLAEQAKARAAARKEREELIANIKQAIADQDRLTLDISTAEIDLAARRRELAALPEAIDHGAELAALKERITKGDCIVRAARDWDRAKTAHQEATARQQAASKKVADLETQVELLGPKGARVAALGDTLGTFQVAINDALAVFGYELRFSLDPWGVLVNGRSASLLSASERLRVGVALQMAVATQAGLDFVAIDEVDKLVNTNRALLTQLVDVFAETGGQVLLAASKDSTYQVPPSSEQMTVYRLALDEQGITRVERMPLESA